VVHGGNEVDKTFIHASPSTKEQSLPFHGGTGISALSGSRDVPADSR